MVVDKIENSNLYVGMNDRFIAAFEYLKKTDFSLLESGKYSVDGNDIFAIINEYETKDHTDGNLEAHKKYIDIQFMSSGSEKIGVATKRNQTPVKTYDSKDDYHLFNEKCNFVSLTKGMFGIFYPDDLHLTGIRNNSSEKVKKIVVKVLI